MLTPERLFKIRQSLEKITPGPWRWEDGSLVYTHPHAGTLSVGLGKAQQVHDDAFIASAPDMVRDLLGEVVRLKEELADYKRVFNKVMSERDNLSFAIQRLIELGRDEYQGVTQFREADVLWVGALEKVQDAHTIDVLGEDTTKEIDGDE